MFKKAHIALLKWYRIHGRHNLPWRMTDDAYKIWVSEVMLQQTQVKTVLERFYFPFLKAFPTIQHLAYASEDNVLKKWEGLGYYTRCRNLHKTAKICQTALPKEVDLLIALPGIGRSTAHAIASFSHHTPVPILDANVKRILYRIFGIKVAKERELWDLAYQLFDSSNPYHYNQAMMDLGATLCQAKSVDCDHCPFQQVCIAKEKEPLDYPQKKAKKITPKRVRHITVHERDGKFALRQRKTKLLHGLWGFIEHDTIQDDTNIGEIVHKYTHFHLYATVYHTSKTVEEVAWFTKEEISKLALSGADHKILRLLQKATV